MSGIEIVGLVLGGIPLIISAMEHYAHVVSALGHYRRYKLELQTLMNSLSTEKANLMDTCEKLLLGIVPPWEIEKMTEDPFGNGRQWENTEIQEKIRRRLYKNYTVFENNVRDIHAAIQELQDQLQLQPDGKVSQCPTACVVSPYDYLTICRHTGQMGRGQQVHAAGQAC